MIGKFLVENKKFGKVCFMCGICLVTIHQINSVPFKLKKNTLIKSQHLFLDRLAVRHWATFRQTRI